MKKRVNEREIAGAGDGCTIDGEEEVIHGVPLLCHDHNGCDVA